jgi:hypothetical protein
LLLQVAINERRYLRVKQIQQLHQQIDKANAEEVQRQKQLELERFQGL